MAITATVGSSTNTSATVGSSTNTSSTVSASNKSQVVAVTVPGPKGDAGLYIYVDTTLLTDGSMIMYSGSTEKWVAKNDLDTETGTIILSGGNF